MQSNEPQAARFSLPGWLATILHVILAAALPLALILVNARAMMTPLFLQWEYNRPGFPADPFGFTTEDRLRYAPLALDYLFNDKGTEFLAEQTGPDGAPLYNERELSHMNDVKAFTQGLIRFGIPLIVIYAVIVAGLASMPSARPALYHGLRGGAIFTLALILTGVALTTTSFDWFFAQFHRLFSAGNSWIFPYSDTLIRLFPLEFWTDAFALVFGGTLAEALILGGAMWWALRKRR